VIEAAIARIAVPFADCWRPTAANYWGRAKKGHGLAVAREILGDRWARDHMGDKKPVLAQALEAAFNPETSANCIGLGQAEREAAAGWLPPGMAAAIHDDQEIPVETADEGEDETAPDVDGLIDGDDDEPETGEDDLPAFLTEDGDEGNARIAVN
jgi:ParB family chromosome partitioning protein